MGHVIARGLGFCRLKNSIMSMTHMAGTIPGFLSPSVIGEFTSNYGPNLAWRYFFILSACIYYFGAISYCIFGSGERQAWASDEAVLARKSGISFEEAKMSVICNEVVGSEGMKPIDDEEAAGEGQEEGGGDGEQDEDGETVTISEVVSPSALVV